MNIFLTSTDPEVAASHLDDLRLNKMILETAQLLSSSYRRLYYENENLYKDTHLNHPCSIWARKSFDNFYWLATYFNHLNNERKFRTGKDHLSFIKLWGVFSDSINGYALIYNQFKLEFDFNCTNYKNLPVILAYKTQMVEKWNNDKKFPSWTNRNLPSFIKLNFNNKFELV